MVGIVRAIVVAGTLMASESGAFAWSETPTTEQWSNDWNVTGSSASPQPSPSQQPSPSANRLPSTPSRDSAAAEACGGGGKVWILYYGSWYAGKALRGPDAEGRCYVTYDGFEPSYDEWVGPDRLRIAEDDGSLQSGFGSASVGKYSCYTFDGGQLNYTHTDVVIESGNRYSVGDKSGTYAMSADGGMTFSGTLSNAAGTYELKSGGVPQIGIVFDGDARASMACSKAR